MDDGSESDKIDTLIMLTKNFKIQYKAGFTLVEIMLVIIIIGILATAFMI